VGGRDDPKPGDLARLAKARGRLRYWRLATPEQFRAAAPEQLAELGADVVATVRELLDRDCVRSRLLWWDADVEGCDWSLYELGHGGYKRGVSLSFKDSFEGERRAWAMLAGLVRGSGGATR
jgi:hypothetical protein